MTENDVAIVCEICETCTGGGAVEARLTDGKKKMNGKQKVDYSGIIQLPIVRGSIHEYFWPIQRKSSF